MRFSEFFIYDNNTGSFAPGSNRKEQSIMLKTICLIPARGGSKGIPRKNIISLAGKPMIAWTIEAALQSDCLDRILVSTDDAKIARIAEEWGAQVPFMRPAELSLDTSSTIDVALHAISWLEQAEGRMPDYLLLLQPTSPLRTREDIDSARRMASERDAEAVVSICEAIHHPYLTKRLGEDCTLSEFMPDGRICTRRQDFPPAYALNGAIYLSSISSLLRDKTFLPERTYGCIMPADRSIDIDTPWDLHLADLILRDRLARG
jgi:CMP-N,N'-diacetyllegionaminic acid synthase